jgi:glycyl-tRNA synthetase
MMRTGSQRLQLFLAKRNRTFSVKADPLGAIISLCMKRGFIFPSADLYPSAGIGYDYGPLGAQLKHNLLARWWRDFITRRRDVVALDSCVLSSAAVWQGSGHLQNFVDPLTECKSCRKRFRADHLVEAEQAGSDLVKLTAAIEHLGRVCPSCSAHGVEGLGGK